MLVQAGILLAGCTTMIPDSATQENQTLLYGKFYEAGFKDTGLDTDELARKLELCGRQLYVKDKGFFGAMREQEKHGKDVSIGEVVDLFTEDACMPPETVDAGDGKKTVLDAAAADR